MPLTSFNMNFLTRTISKIIPNFLSAPGAVLEAVAKDNKKRISKSLKRQRSYRANIGQDELRMARIQAEDPINPRREALLSIYKEIWRDLHLRSQIRTAINEVISEPWALVDKKTKKINEAATELVKSKWFDNISRYVLEAEFWGHSLIEFGLMVENIEDSKAIAPLVFTDVKIIPREHVRPETGEILLNPWDHIGFPYREEPFNTWLIEAGDPCDLGLLEACATYSIYKKFALSDWSRSSEKWGDPLLVLFSSSDDDAENDAKEEMASGFGNNGYIITSSDDKAEILERKNGNGYKIFQDKAEFCNEENSKGINGQTGTSDNQAWSGTANVHERILTGYTSTRLQELYYFHNDKTIPFLKEKGYNLEGLEWSPIRFTVKIDPTDKKPNEEEGASEKKKFSYQQKSIME